uniref:Integrator complex subunit 4 n=2 Tax=Percomorphaceae TaxID=1489872 RepID=A0AAV2J526_KNICA
MAAHLKKRVYEEFTKTVQLSQDEAPAKRLRLSKPSKSAALHVDLCKAASSTDALQHLLQFARRSVEAESVEGVIRILLEHYYKEVDNSVRLKIASLIGHLSKTPGFRPDCIVEDTINTLSTEKSHQVLSQLLHALLLIGSQLTDTPSVRQRLVQVSCQHLSDTYFGVRNNCLQLLGCVGLTCSASVLDKDALATGQKDVQGIISDYFGDQDPRVRTAALKAMLQLHSRGMTIQQDIYDQACRLLSDDFEQVRSAAVQMVWVLSQLYPESIVPIPSSNEEIRLVDDAFGKISHMVSDGSWMVRVQAAKTLGNMLQVSPHFLEQTLDKKLMSDLRRKRTAHERAKELFTSGEFSSGRKWADDAPKEKLDTNTVNLMASGACGAFVHGLEDEMFEVRIAAVEALCQLARSSASFAEKCLDFLVDMFNDEIEEVRLQSIHVLREISTHITLREDQLDTVLAVLEDSSRDIREALHELLCYTNVSTKECIQLALLELLKNLNKYPTDRNSVWKCLKFVGQRHPTLVLPLVPELLSTHPYFDTPEPDMDDPAYIAVLVLVFNAAQTCPTMPALFSDHTFRHYAYLRDSLSHLVPLLTLPGRKQPYCLETVASASASASVEAAQLFLQQSLLRVENTQNLEAAGAQDLLNLTIRDLQRVGELQTELAGAADFCATYLHCQLLLSQMSLCSVDLSEMSLCSVDLSEMFLCSVGLSEMSLCSVGLSEMSLCSVGLSEMSLCFVDLSEMSLCSVGLSEMSLCSVGLSEMSLCSVDLSEMSLCSVDLSEMSLCSVGLSEMSLCSVDLSEMSLCSVDLSEMSLCSVGLSEMSLCSVGLSEMSLCSVDLSEMSLCSVGLSEMSSLCSVGLSEMSLCSVGLSEMSLCSVGLSEMSLSLRYLSEMSLCSVGLSEMSLCSVGLSEMSLCSVGLSEMSLCSVGLSEMSLCSVDLSEMSLCSALQEKLWRTAVPLCLKQNNTATQAAQQMVEETFRLEFLYSGLESRQMAALHHVRLQARALQLLLSARTRQGLDSLGSSCDRFLMDIDHFQRLFLSELPHLKDTFVDKVLELRPRLSSCAPVEVVKLLQSTLRQSGLLLPTLPPQIQKATATIIEPTGESDNPLRFTSGLVVALDIDATLEHVQDPQNTVKVQVQYPDGQSHLIHPKPGDFRRPGPSRHRLITQVYLSHTAWTEPCQISVRLLLAYSSTAPGGAESEGPQADIQGTIPFSKPVKVFIMPKPTRR